MTMENLWEEDPLKEENSYNDETGEMEEIRTSGQNEIVI